MLMVATMARRPLVISAASFVVFAARSEEVCTLKPNARAGVAPGGASTPSGSRSRTACGHAQAAGLPRERLHEDLLPVSAVTKSCRSSS
eukprot:11434278-Heterocapsa_arctica.AAC.1